MGLAYWRVVFSTPELKEHLSGWLEMTTPQRPSGVSGAAPRPNRNLGLRVAFKPIRDFRKQRGPHRPSPKCGSAAKLPNSGGFMLSAVQDATHNNRDTSDELRPCALPCATVCL